MWKEGMEMCGPFGRYLMKRYMRSWCSTEGHLKLMIRSALFLSFHPKFLLTLTHGNQPVSPPFLLFISFHFGSSWIA